MTVKRALRLPLLALLLLALAVPAPAAAAAEACTLDPAPSDLLGNYLAHVRGCLEGDEARTQAVAALAAETKEKVESLPSSGEPGSGFAARVRDGLADFLPLLHLSAESLVASDDGSALNVNFNPIRSADLGSLGIVLQIQQPEPSEEVLKSVDAAQRAAAKELIDERLGDFDQLTWTVKWGYERPVPADALSRRDAPWLWGRSYKRYRPLVENQLLPRLLEAAGGDLPADEQRLLGDCEVDAGRWAEGRIAGFDSPRNLTLGQLRLALGDDYQPCLAAWVRQEADVVDLDRKLDALSLLPFLIDNQPQLVASLVFDERDELVGRDSVEAAISFEMGLYNLNTLLRQNARQADGAWTALRAFPADLAKSENKFTFSLRYVERSAYRLDRSFGEGAGAVTVTADLPQSEEWCGKLQYSRNATWHRLKIDGKEMYPRFHLSAEYVDVSDDPQRQDRLVAKATYEIPVSGQSAIPVSLTYASKAEFLGDVDKQLSAHLGLSYKLPGKN